jgi:hypothetical protein
MKQTINYTAAKQSKSLAKTVNQVRKQSAKKGVHVQGFTFRVEGSESFAIPSNEYLQACGQSAFQSFTSKF